MVLRRIAMDFGGFSEDFDFLIDFEWFSMYFGGFRGISRDCGGFGHRSGDPKRPWVAKVRFLGDFGVPKWTSENLAGHRE